MKTDQLVSVAFPNGTLNIYHKSQMGNLKDVFKLVDILPIPKGRGFWIQTILA